MGYLAIIVRNYWADYRELDSTYQRELKERELFKKLRAFGFSYRDFCKYAQLGGFAQ